jgi:hypothetical protein
VPRFPAAQLGRPFTIISGKTVMHRPWNQALIGVACSTPTDCTAAGQFYAGFMQQIGGSFVMHFNGTTMSKVLLLAKGPPPLGHPNGEFAGLACTGTVRCISWEAQQNPDAGLVPGSTSVLGAVQLDPKGWYPSSVVFGKRQQAQPSDASCLANGRCLIVGRVERFVPTLPNYPEGRWTPLVVEARARHI